jgi:hypothetical protein
MYNVSNKVDMTDLKIDRMKVTDLDDVMEIEQASFSMPWSRRMFESAYCDHRCPKRLSA